MTIVEQLFDVGSKLPPPALAELLNFAQFLQQKCPAPQAAEQVSLAELRGGLEGSTTFTGTPVAIQEAMRREWT